MKQKLNTAEEILERTMRYVAPLPCQEAFVRQLASILSMHIHKNKLMDHGFLPDDLPPVSAIIVAPPGQGKTFLLRKMTECVNLNLITVDCSTLAAEGWKGVGLAQRLLTASKMTDNRKEFDQSILFLDEVDKLHHWGTEHDQGNPMSNILQMYNTGYVTAEDSGKGTVNIDIRRFTVLLGGAFDGISSLIESRLHPKNKIGFVQEYNQQEKTEAELLRQVSLEDLTAYGMLPELIGQIGTIFTIPPLSEEDYRQLLCSNKSSIQVQYSNYLQGLYGVKFALTETAVDMITKECMVSNIGARAVVPIVNDLMRDAISVVEQDKTINRVIVDKDNNELHVRYEHGERGYCFLSSDRNNLPEHIITAKNTVALASKLCRYYKKAGGDALDLPVLQAFFECSLEFLKEHSPQEDFCFDSLEKLARTVQRDENVSSFEGLLYGCSIDAFQRFLDCYTPFTPCCLVTALQQIMNFLETYHQKVTIRFALK